MRCLGNYQVQRPLTATTFLEEGIYRFITLVRLPYKQKFYIYFRFILLQKIMWRWKLANNHLLYFNGFLTKSLCDLYGPNHWPCLNAV